MNATDVISFHERVLLDCEEIKEIAEWFDLRGNAENGAFLRNVAMRYETISGAYNTASVRVLELGEIAEFARRLEARGAFAPCSCADDETAADIAVLRTALARAQGGLV